MCIRDSGMSIKKNVGGVATLLARQHLNPGYLKFKRGYRTLLHSIPGGKWLYDLTHRIKKAIKGSILPSTFFEDLGLSLIHISNRRGRPCQSSSRRIWAYRRNKSPMRRRHLEGED